MTDSSFERVGLPPGSVVEVVVQDISRADAPARRLGTQRITLKSGQQVPIAFWSFGRRGATALTRSMGVPTWAAIAANYPADVRVKVAALMGGIERAEDAGRLYAVGHNKVAVYKLGHFAA